MKPLWQIFRKFCLYQFSQWKILQYTIPSPKIKQSKVGNYRYVVVCILLLSFAICHPLCCWSLEVVVGGVNVVV